MAQSSDRLVSNLLGTEQIALTRGDAGIWAALDDVRVLKTVRRKITPEEINVAVPAAIEIIPAPGAGKVFYVTQSLISLDYGGTAYVLNGTTVDFRYHGTTTVLIAPSSGFFTATVDRFRYSNVATLVDGTQSWTGFENLGLDFKMTGGTGVTDGNSPIFITLKYFVAELTW